MTTRTPTPHTRGIKGTLIRWMVQLERFIDRPWYLPVIAFLVIWDMLVFFIPADGFMVSAVLLRPKRWVRIAAWLALGSSLGALFLGWAIELWGTGFVHEYLSWAVDGENWNQVSDLVRDCGFWAVAGTALGPFPIQPAIILAALGGMPAGKLFVSMLVGRFLKNLILCWIGSYAPALISRIIGIRKDVQTISEAEKEVFLSNGEPLDHDSKRK